MPETSAKKKPGGIKPRAASHPAWRVGKIAGVAFLLVFSISLAGLATLREWYTGKAYPGVFLGATAVSGKSSDVLTTELTKYSDALAAQGVAFTYKEQMVSISPVLLPEGDIDFAYEMFAVDVDASVTSVLALGRTGSVLGQQIAVADALLTKQEIPLTYSFDREYLRVALEREFSDVIVPANDAEFQRNDRGELIVVPEADGMTLSFDSAFDTLEANLAAGIVPKPFPLQEEVARADVSATALESVRAKAEEVIHRGDVLITGPEDKRWTLTPEMIAPLISADGKGELRLHTANADTLLQEIGTDVVIEPKNGKFTREENKVVEFQVATPGRQLDVPKTREMLASLLTTDVREGAISLTEVEPDVTAKEIETLGVGDLIGVGHSNFKGSPVNRRYNIGVGAATLNGILIAPDEEFSLVKALGRIDASTGYRQELVIKENKTIPEYGGGLCQIGTTTFRAALASGLPITARKSHSYVVSYYNDANGLPGTDATIYDPSPDMRFLNDTGHYILIQTRIEGDDLTFEFWGTTDGRVATQTKPIVSNRVSPPPTKYVETTDLPPGQEKCTEKAHAGMDAVFTYTVTYADGKVNEQIFQSHYRPWQAVCLRGIDPAKVTPAPPA